MLSAKAGPRRCTMMKTAAPRLRDRSLLVERQVAAAGDLRLPNRIVMAPLGRARNDPQTR